MSETTADAIVGPVGNPSLETVATEHCGARRVVFFHATPDGPGGSQVSMLAEARALADVGWTAVLVHGQSAAPREVVCEVFTRTVSIPALFHRHWSRSMMRGLAGLDALLDAERPLAAHLHLWASPWLMHFLLKRLPVVATCHVPVCPNGARFRYATEQLCESRVGSECFRSGLVKDGCDRTADGSTVGPAAFALAFAYAKWTLSLLTRCDALVAPSHWQRAMLVKDGVSASRIAVLPPPIPRHVGPATPAGQRPRLRRPVILAASRLSPLKGLHHLLRASALIEIDHEVHLAGSGPAESDLKDLARELGVDRTTRFLGEIGSEALADAFRSADVVVVPSLWPETFGMVGPESLIAGTPVVTYSSGGTADWAVPDSGATVVARGDVAALARELSTALRGRDKGRLSLQQRAAAAARVSPSDHARALADLYERLANRSSRVSNAVRL